MKYKIVWIDGLKKNVESFEDKKSMEEHYKVIQGKGVELHASFDGVPLCEWFSDRYLNQK